MLDDKGIYIYFISCVACDYHVIFFFMKKKTQARKNDMAWASAWLFKPLIKSIIFVIMTWPQSSFLIYTITIEF